MKHILNLPDEIIDNILGFYDPYRKNYQLVLFDLKYRFFWFHFFEIFFPRRNCNFYKYVLAVNKEY